MTAPAVDPGRRPGFQALLVGVFGAATSLGIQLLDKPGLSRLTLLLLAVSTATLLVSLLWFFVLAVGQGPRWWVAMLLPYVNLIAVSMFARRYWSSGARAPALLMIAALLLQVLAALQLLSLEGPALA